MKWIYTTILFLLCAIVTVHVTADEAKEVILDNQWYASLQNSDPIKRLQMLDALKDKVVKASGQVVKVEESNLLKKKYRIILSVNLPRIKILYYCYTDKEDYSDLLQPEDTFEFSGQFIVATPLNTRIDTILCDIILEDGAVVVK
ncbi:MAG: hypothetical protein WHV26_12795 [Spirochaetota bacterium]|jgi:hypothetical protein